MVLKEAWLKNAAIGGLIFVLISTVGSPALAAEPTDYWAGLNKDGHGRNASDHSLVGPIRVRWAQQLWGSGKALQQFFHSRRKGRVDGVLGRILGILFDDLHWNWRGGGPVSRL